MRAGECVERIVRPLRVRRPDSGVAGTDGTGNWRCVKAEDEEDVPRFDLLLDGGNRSYP